MLHITFCHVITCIIRWMIKFLHSPFFSCFYKTTKDTDTTTHESSATNTKARHWALIYTHSIRLPCHAESTKWALTLYAFCASLILPYSHCNLGFTSLTLLNYLSNLWSYLVYNIPNCLLMASCLEPCSLLSDICALWFYLIVRECVPYLYKLTGKFAVHIELWEVVWTVN